MSKLYPGQKTIHWLVGQMHYLTGEYFKMKDQLREALGAHGRIDVLTNEITALHGMRNELERRVETLEGFDVLNTLCQLMDDLRERVAELEAFHKQWPIDYMQVCERLAALEEREVLIIKTLEQAQDAFFDHVGYEPEPEPLPHMELD